MKEVNKKCACMNTKFKTTNSNLYNKSMFIRRRIKVMCGQSKPYTNECKNKF